MSWVNTMLDIGIIGMQASQKNKLEQLQRQNAEAALIEALLRALRDEIFRYKQAADEVLKLESNDPKSAAAGMKILFLQLQDFGLTPDMFPDISDKEYVATTTKSIRDNAKRLEGSLSTEDQAEVDTVVDAAMNLPGYNYYIQHHEVVNVYRQSLPIYDELKTRNNGCVAISVIFGSLVFLPMIFSWHWNCMRWADKH